jgi:methyltransferase family protein
MIFMATLKRSFIGREPIAPERLWLLRQMPKHSICAEVGVYKGNFSAAILKVVEPRCLHLVDPWTYQERYSKSWFGGDLGGSQAVMDRLHERVRRRFRDEKDNGQVVINRGFSEQVASQFPDAYFDWIYIDANHAYDSVKTDLHAFYPKIRNGGFITGDNYGYKSEWWWRDGVQRAVDEFVADGWCTLGSISNDQFMLIKHPSRISERRFA